MRKYTVLPIIRSEVSQKEKHQGGFFKGLFVYFTDGCPRFSVAAHSLSLVGASGGYSLVAVCGLVIPVASLIAACGL